MPDPSSSQKPTVFLRTFGQRVKQALSPAFSFLDRKTARLKKRMTTPLSGKKNETELLKKIDYNDLTPKTVFQWLWISYLFPWRHVVAVMVFCMLIAAFVESSIGLFFGEVLKVTVESKSLLASLFAGLQILTLFFLRAGAAFCQTLLSQIVTANTMTELRSDLTRKIMSLDINFFDKNAPGDLITRVGQNVETVRTFVSRTTLALFRDLMIVFFSTLILLWLSWKLFLLVLVAAPCIAAIVVWSNKKIRTLQSVENKSFSLFVISMDEAFHGIRTVKISNQEKQEEERIMESVRSMRDMVISRSRITSTIPAMVDFIVAVLLVGLILVGSYETIAGRMETFDLFKFMMVALVTYKPLKSIVSLNAQIQMGVMGVKRLAWVMQQEPKVIDKPNALTEFNANGDIVFKDVKFAYDPENKVFENLNLTLKAGQRTAFVGETGSGKTTVLGLLARLYDVNEGSVSIGGTDVRDLKSAALREQLSIVSQDIVLFDDTLENNIRYGNPDATDEDIQKAVKAASLESVFKEKGPHARVGPRGSKLSGGQKQRVGIARALLRKAPIILLDEATSALDQNTENKITQALVETFSNSTVAMIAHRLSTVQDADCIYVINEGRVIESGKHEELLALEGFYYQLYKAQKKEGTQKEPDIAPLSKEKEVSSVKS